MPSMYEETEQCEGCEHYHKDSSSYKHCWNPNKPNKPYLPPLYWCQGMEYKGGVKLKESFDGQIVFGMW